jgi:hypothetical protein
MAILGTLIPVPVALASGGNGNSGKPPVEKSPKVDTGTKDKKNPINLVPEPSTIALLAAAAGVAGARKLWQKRRGSRSV